MYSPFKKTGKAVTILQKLQNSKQFAWAKVDVRSSSKKNLDRLIIGIGQVHPVLRGSYSYFLARTIGIVQTWIFEVCTVLHTKHGVRSFGEEGYSEVVDGVHRTRLHSSILQECTTAMKKHKDLKKFMLSTAQKWRKGLKHGNQKEIERTHAVLNALTLLQAMHKNVTVFPIEQVDVHGRIGKAIKELQDQIQIIEHSSVYQNVQRKGGKKLTKEEFTAATERNALVKSFNAILNHPDREKSILREVLQHAEGVPVTVFVLGQAHKQRCLHLAKKYMPSDTLFVWITPPGLYSRMQTWLIRTGVVVVIACGLYIFWSN